MCPAQELCAPKPLELGGIVLKPRYSFAEIFSLALILISITKISLGAEASAEVSQEKLQVESKAESSVTNAPTVTTAEGVRVETRIVETSPLEVLKGEDLKSEKLASEKRETVHTKVENNIILERRDPATGIAAAAAPAVISAVAQEATSSRPMSITPLAGYTAFQGAWYSHIANRGTVGLILDIPLISILSLEAEGHFGRFNMSYSGYGRNFNQYSGGANAKFTLGRGIFQPYVGAGMAALYYEGIGPRGMSLGPQTNQVIGAGQVFAGAEINLFAGIAIGARAEFLRPMMNLPPRMGTSGQWGQPAGQPGGQIGQSGQSEMAAEGDVMSSAFHRLMATVRVSF